MRRSSGRPRQSAQRGEGGQKSPALWLQPWKSSSTPTGRSARGPSQTSSTGPSAVRACSSAPPCTANAASAAAATAGAPGGGGSGGGSRGSGGSVSGGGASGGGGDAKSPGAAACTLPVSQFVAASTTAVKHALKT